MRMYSATVVKAGEETNTWIVTPAYTRNDGQSAPNILAYAQNGITPSDGDIVLCAESINPSDHSSVRFFDDNGGACPVIIGTFADIMNLALEVIIQKLQCGEGSQPMVLGNKLATYCQGIDTWAAAITAWAKTVSPAFSGAVYTAWSSDNLSENHTLD